jgi:hypothetical protein
MEFDPSVNPFVVVARSVSAAEPLTSCEEPSVFAPDLNVTVPVADIWLGTAISVTEAPTFTELGAETVIVVGPLFTVTVTLEVELVLSVSPL